MPGTVRRCVNTPTPSELRWSRNHGCVTSTLARQVGDRNTSSSPAASAAGVTSRNSPAPFSCDASRLPSVTITSRRRAPPNQLKFVYCPSACTKSTVLKPSVVWAARSGASRTRTMMTFALSCSSGTSIKA